MFSKIINLVLSVNTIIVLLNEVYSGNEPGASYWNVVTKWRYHSIISLENFLEQLFIIIIKNITNVCSIAVYYL